MLQLVYDNKLLLCGKPDEITKQIRELGSHYKTVKELIDFYHRKMLEDN